MSKLSIAVFVVIVAAFIAAGTWYNRGLDERAGRELAAEQGRLRDERTKIMEKLIKEDVVVGTGAEAKTGDTVKVHYEGTFENGEKFDSSYDRNEPFEVTLGAGQVIQGWDVGLVGMKVGGKRRLTIPPELAYGEQGIGPVPPNATLKFSIELLGVTSTSPAN